MRYVFGAKRDFDGVEIYGDLIQYESGERAIIDKPMSRYGYEATEISNRTKVKPETVYLKSLEDLTEVTE
jgi:hypothetical protein